VHPPRYVLANLNCLNSLKGRCLRPPAAFDASLRGTEESPTLIERGWIELYFGASGFYLLDWAGVLSLADFWFALPVD